MKALPRKLLTLSASLAVAALSLGDASAQAVKAIADKPAFEDLPSPEFGGNKQKPFKPKDWLEIEAKLQVAMRPEPKSKTCERMTVKWYVAVNNPEKAGTLLLLTKDVEHVNVPLEEDVYVSIYLSPASVKRLTGGDRAGKRTVEYVGYEVLVDGEKVAQATTKEVQGKVNWWNLDSDRISRSDTVPLLNKAETPFAVMWWDRYAEISDKSGQ